MNLFAVFVILFLIMSANSESATSQETSANFSLGGGIRIGSTLEACTPTLAGAIRYQDNQIQLCDGNQWNAGPIGNSGPTGCPNVGDACADGSVYVGLSPDGNLPMYTTAADAPGTYEWSLTFSNYGITGTATGAANTAAIVAAGGPGNDPAANYCDNLTMHGYSDWYLPAIDETMVMAAVSNVGALSGTFTGSFYWSSTEVSLFVARIQDGLGIENGSKDDTHSVRCVRKQVPATGAVSANFSQGSIMVGYSGLACNGTNAGVIRYLSSCKKMEFCNGSAWSESGSADPCNPCGAPPAIGTTCGDGSVYAGLSPDGNVPMYTTPADAGQFSWNDGTGNWVNTPMQDCITNELSCTTGYANTALLVGLGSSPSPAPYAAAQYCNNLNAHSHSDWYLPSRAELGVLFANRIAIGGFNTSGSFPAGFYWSSSERGSSAWDINFSNGAEWPSTDTGESVRCVRRSL